MISFSASVRFGFPYNSISSLSGRKFLKELNKTKRWIVYLKYIRTSVGYKACEDKTTYVIHDDTY